MANNKATVVKILKTSVIFFSIRYYVPKYVYLSGVYVLADYTPDFIWVFQPIGFYVNYYSQVINLFGVSCVCSDQDDTWSM